MSFVNDVFGTVTGAALDYYNKKDDQLFAANQAKKNRNFQREMSNTAHQREVADLRAAGLNPILSANAGASTPGGSMGSSSSDGPSLDPKLFSELEQMSLQKKQTKAAIDATNAGTKNTNVDTGLKAANTKTAEQTVKLMQAQTAKEAELARSAMQTANLQDKYGEAGQIMSLVSSGTGAIGNVLGVGNLLRQVQNFLKPNATTIRENYSSRGEHTGTTTTTTRNH